MERAERAVRSYILSEDSEEHLNVLVSDIAISKVTLLHVVKALGDFLTAEDDTIRVKGVELLSVVLTRCPPEKINRRSAQVLTVFYCEKLDDPQIIIPSLKGLAPLASNPSFGSEDAMTVVKAIFQHVTMRVHVQSTRLLVFTIIDSLLARYRDALKTSLGNEFLRGYIHLAEGEKDPRNLLLAFSIVRVILLEFDISSHIDDLFNITFCYFPITFRPPPDDPYGITPEDLKAALRSCLSATPLFGPLALPLYLEKLSAGSGSTKQDTMQTIALCLPIYGVTVSRSHAARLWSALKIEIFQPIDSETAECALETTRVLVRTIYPATDKAALGEAPEGLVEHIVEECLEILKEPEKSKAKPAIQVLAAIVRTTPSITRYTVSRTVPHLVQLFHDPEESVNRPATLTALGTIIQAIRDIFTVKSVAGIARSYEMEKPLDPDTDEVLGIFTAGLKGSASTSAALMGLDALVNVPGVLTDEEVGFVVHNINEVLSAGEDLSENVRTTAIDVLYSVSLTSPKHIEEITLPLLFSSLPDTAPPREADVERAKYKRILTLLSRLCVQPPLFEILVIRLSTKLDLVCAPNTSSTADNEINAAYAHYILFSLSAVITAKVEAGHADIPKYLDRLVPRLYNLFIAAAIVHERGLGITAATHPRLIQVAAKVVAQIVQTLPTARQQNFSECLFKAWLHGQVRAVADGHQHLPLNTTFFIPFKGSASAAQKELIPLFSAPVITFHKEVRLPVDDDASFLSVLLDWALDAANDVQAVAAVHVVASLVNKHAEALPSFMASLLNSFWNHNLADTGASLCRRRRAVRAWAWLTKALVFCNYVQAQEFVDRLFVLFGDESLAWDAAKAIGDIGSGGANVLTKKNFAVLKVLAVQKFFNSVLPRLVAGAQSPEGMAQQRPYLVAVASLVKSISMNMYAHEMPELMPLLLRGLDLPDLGMRADVIETIHNAARDASTSSEVKTAISEHAPSLVTVMLKNSSTKYSPASRLRKGALRCLGTLPQVVQYDILHPYKSQVIRDLGVCLDDPQRDVRREAVDARESWYRYCG